MTEKVEKKEIIPCRKGCEECAYDILAFNELIEELSKMHLTHSNDPETLCLSPSQYFQKEFHMEYSKLQSRLFEIASKHNLSWTDL